jgi:ATP-dependent Lon protease
MQDLNGIGMTSQLSLTAFVALSSATLYMPAISSMEVQGDLNTAGINRKI